MPRGGQAVVRSTAGAPEAARAMRSHIPMARRRSRRRMPNTAGARVR